MGLMQFTESQQQQALGLARQAIAYGMRHHQNMPVEEADYDPLFSNHACCFVTLKKQDKLRGCIGALQPYQSLLKDIVEHAYGAAFRDHRFQPVTEDELSELTISISVLTPQLEIFANTEQALFEQLEVGKDGLTIEEGFNKATFLPAVWEQLPDKKTFLTHLKRKAGMPDSHWSSSLQFYKYQTISFSEA